MELFSFQSFLFIFFFFISLYIFLFFHKPKIQRTQNSGFKFYPLVGTLPEFLRNRHRFLDWTTEVLSSCPTKTAVLHRPGNVHGIITANPVNVEHMLKTNFENYPKGTRFITLLEDFLGKGIFNSDGKLWKIQRKTASYEFNTKSLRNFVMETVTMELQSRLVPILENAAKTKNVLDVQDFLERFAFDNICKVAFNVDPGCLGGGENEFMQAFEEAANLSAGRFLYALPFLYKIKKFFDMGSEKKLRESIKTVHEFADKIIRSRMQERAEKKDEDLLSRFIGNSESSAEFLRDIVISFILAGRDSTSSSLSWFFWLLSSRPDVEETILKEIESIRACNKKRIGETYTFDELREMHYLHAAISEAMRLYPPVPVDTKACREEDTMPDGTVVGKNWFVTYHTYAMGRMESIWGEDCCEYKPERWLENGKKRDSSVYKTSDINEVKKGLNEYGIYKPESAFRFPVFHAGPRICLGKDMAFIQMKSIVASVLERFELDVLLEKGKCPEHLLSLTLRMKGGLPVMVKERRVNRTY